MTKTWKAADKQKLTIADRSFKFTLTLLFDPRHIFKTASELQKLIKNNLNVSTISNSVHGNLSDIAVLGVYEAE